MTCFLFWLPPAKCAEHILQHILRGHIERSTPLITNLSLVPRSKLASLPCGQNDRILQAKASNVAVSSSQARPPVDLRSCWVKSREKAKQKAGRKTCFLFWLPLLDLNQRSPAQTPSAYCWKKHSLLPNHVFF